MNLHPKTGRPIQPYATFEVGEIVTEGFLGDASPAVVVHVTAKTVYVRPVAYVATPVAIGTGHDRTEIVADPDSVEAAVKAGKAGARKYVLRISKNPDRGASFADRERYTEDGGSFHRAKWALPNSTAGSLVKGGFTKRDPHV